MQWTPASQVVPVVNVVAFEAHQDDITIFAAFTAIRLQAHCVTVLHGDIQGNRGRPITRTDRLTENMYAMQELGLPHEQWNHSDANPDWSAVGRDVAAIDAIHAPGTVLAPFAEPGGHDDHNMLGELCQATFGDRCVLYTTYTRSSGRTRTDREVAGEPDQIVRKHRALACHLSQIAEPSCRPWFVADLHEYLAAA